MVIFQRIEVDLDKERNRIDEVFKDNRRQRNALHTLVNLFEKGQWQECLDHVNDKKAFPYNREGEYPEQEHIGIEISRILRDLPHGNFYTQDDLMNEAKEKLTHMKKLVG